MVLFCMSSLQADVVEIVDSSRKMEFDFLQNVAIALQTHL
jgi:hypothetical protein